jgi:hypothetical protein
MATRINVIIKIDTLIKVIEPLLIKHGIDVYVDKLKSNVNFEKYNFENRTLGLDDNYNRIFFVENSANVNNVKHFYEDDICKAVLECSGGRYNNTEVEKVEMRLVSKTPNKLIKAFSADMAKFIKNSNAFGVGILPLTNTINKSTYYYKQEAMHNTIWFYFDKKQFHTPIQIALDA